MVGHSFDFDVIGGPTPPRSSTQASTPAPAKPAASGASSDNPAAGPTPPAK